MRSNGAARAKQHAASVAHQGATASSGLQRILEQLMKKVRVAIVFGGDKSSPGSVIYQSQNARSWKSYEAVAEDIAASLRRSGFRNVELIPEDMALGDRLRSGTIHMAWLNTGGVEPAE